MDSLEDYSYNAYVHYSEFLNGIIREITFSPQDREYGWEKRICA
ncbi:MAG: hypothetical protein PHY07_07595 [Methanosarcina sp.]|nr:hypothetical protein [Methanosarcina sp.]